MNQKVQHKLAQLVVKAHLKTYTIKQVRQRLEKELKIDLTKQVREFQKLLISLVLAAGGEDDQESTEESVSDFEEPKKRPKKPTKKKIKSSVDDEADFEEPKKKSPKQTNSKRKILDSDEDEDDFVDKPVRKKRRENPKLTSGTKVNSDKTNGKKEVISAKATSTKPVKHTNSSTVPKQQTQTRNSSKVAPKANAAQPKKLVGQSPPPAKPITPASTTKTPTSIQQTSNTKTPATEQMPNPKTPTSTQKTPTSTQKTPITQPKALPTSTTSNPKTPTSTQKTPITLPKALPTSTTSNPKTPASTQTTPSNQKTPSSSKPVPIYKLSAQLSSLCGKATSTQIEVVKAIFYYISKNNLRESNQIVADEKLKSLFKVDTIPIMELSNLLKPHLVLEKSDLT